MVQTDLKPTLTSLSDFDLKTYLQTKKELVEKALDESLTIEKPEKIYEAMRYSLLAGGKRLRPILCLATAELLSQNEVIAMPTACALEMIHTMSLIHDDLPAMDNDNYRRGRLTNHKVYGEDIAILAGDGLLAYAFEYVAENTKNIPTERIVKVLGILAKAVGANGLVGGQVMDLDCEGKSDVTAETLTSIHRKKTGALLEACVSCGAVLSGASIDDLTRLSIYAQNIGLAFQIIDDILDVTATTEELGKTAGKDISSQKATYPKLWGIQTSQTKAEELVNDAITQLSVYGKKALPLQAIAQYIVKRKN
ncbi:geranylgeranyl diphosphate synthase CrtE [Geminocystis sp. GBBB08]|uniref:geranylgeranyl diphosphate synthase CrtE n=1 Tax=Geminocystis sp. GBBB08 TaxID=2604140 RepID=UPI0027E3AF8A|nr:farnesyl diphosphate synthase [Geminocystis sp. GBBB08]MBL1209400.1 polyprenyl synthetase family protein [Geminocystis sp. GBBB08]